MTSSGLTGGLTPLNGCVLSCPPDGGRVPLGLHWRKMGTGARGRERVGGVNARTGSSPVEEVQVLDGANLAQGWLLPHHLLHLHCPLRGLKGCPASFQPAILPRHKHHRRWGSQSNSRFWNEPVSRTCGLGPGEEGGYFCGSSQGSWGEPLRLCRVQCSAVGIHYKALGNVPYPVRVPSPLQAWRDPGLWC